MRRATPILALLSATALSAVTIAAATLDARAQNPLSPEPIASQPAPQPAAPASPAPASSAPAPVSATPAAPVAAPAASAPLPGAAPVQPASPPAGAAQATPAAPAAPPKPAKPKPPPPPPREMALSDDPTPVLQPETFFTTAKASERYAAIVDAGGWPVVSGDLKPGAKGPAVATLRRRLAIEGDIIGAEANGTAWTPALTAAVKRFQFRNGLKQTGIVAGATLKAMNVPANVRFKQLASSAQRLAGLNFPFGDKYVAVNIPSTAVDAIENGRVAHRYAAIVGGPDHQSPQITAKIVAINLNPTWTVPVSIIKNEIIPKMRKQPNYLSRARIRILDGHGQEVNPASINWNSDRATNYTLRQDSGKGNSLGLIRIQMPNPDAVYMHDTPSRNLFANDYRFLSHGCVRVQGVYDLAAWLLQGVPVTGGSIAAAPASGDPLLASAAATISQAPGGSSSGALSGGWTGQLIQQKIATGAREDIKLPKPVPVVWVYMTGWASADGTIHFRDDVYNVDTVGG
jgi:murein L,D-transpeptidase YcbB/YkuD